MMVLVAATPCSIGPHSQPRLCPDRRHSFTVERDRRIHDRAARTPHFPPHFRPRRSLSDRRGSVFILGLTRRTPDDGIRARALPCNPQRNSRLGFESPRQLHIGALGRPGFQLFDTHSEGEAFNQVNLGEPRCRGVPKRTAEKSIHPIEVQAARGREPAAWLGGERSAGMAGSGTRCRWPSTVDQSR